MEEWGYSCTILDYGTRWSWVATTLPTPCHLTREERAPCSNWIVGCVGLRAGLYAVDKRKKNPCRGPNPWPSELSRMQHRSSASVARSSTCSKSVHVSSWRHPGLPASRPLGSARCEAGQAVFGRWSLPPPSASKIEQTMRTLRVHISAIQPLTHSGKLQTNSLDCPSWTAVLDTEEPP
jgi:hypothetical protein